MFSYFLLFTLGSLLHRSCAIPIGPITILKSATAETISSDDLDTQFFDAARFARMAYCPSAIVINKTCGRPCDENPGYTILASGGDNGKIPRYYVAHDEPGQRIVVAHQGTHTKDVLSDINDLKLDFDPLDTTAFPNASTDGVQVHDGFQQTFYRTAADIMGNVTDALNSTGTKSVLVVGHSLGAAVALFDGFMLQQQLPSDVSLEVKLFGLPRTGNDKWADLIQSTLGQGNFAFMTNKKDPVPTVPPLFMGYTQLDGEVHIASSDSLGADPVAIKCQGRNSLQCSASTSLLKSEFKDHRGPYLHNITMGGGACPPFV